MLQGVNAVQHPHPIWVSDAVVLVPYAETLMPGWKFRPGKISWI